MFNYCRGLFGTGGYGMGAGWIGGLIMFVGFILIGIIFYLIVRNSGKSRYVSSAQSILDERLARGDIDEEAHHHLSEKIK